MFSVGAEQRQRGGKEQGLCIKNEQKSILGEHRGEDGTGSTASG